MKKLIPITFLSAFYLVSAGQISIDEARNMATGTKVTVAGVVLNGDELGPIRYIQDSTAAIGVYPSSGSVPLNAVRGDKITVSGTIDPFNELIEITGLTSAEVISSGNPLPDPVVITPDQMGVHLEGQLVRFENISFINASGTFAGDKNYIVSYEGKQGEVRIYRDSPIVGSVIPTGPVNLIGICSRFHSTFQMLPRDLDDIEIASPIFFSKLPVVSDLSQTGFRLDWETNINGSTEVTFGNTPDLEKGHVKGLSDTTAHNFTVTAEGPSELFYVRIMSVSGEDTAVLEPRVYITPSESSGDIKVYFNREVENSVSTGMDALRVYRALDDTLIHYINRAQETIDFTIYNFNLKEVSNITAALNAAHARGVRVRVIHDGEENNSGFDNLDLDIGLIKSPTTYPDYGIMHNKFIVFDAGHSDPYVPVVWTGSTNFTDSQVNLDPNSVIIVQDKSLAMAYTLEFNEMFGSDGPQPDPGKALFGKFKKDNSPHEFIIGGRQVQCWFSPTDNVNARIKETINLATKDISVATMLITKTDIAYELEDQHDAGVVVRVLVNSKASCSTYVRSTLEESLGPMFIEATESGIMHHKYMLVDRNGTDPILWVGCHNWSSSADVVNDENTLVIRDATLVNLYYQEFYKRFSASGGSVGLQRWELDGRPWKVYPNPVSGELQILYDGYASVRAGIELYNLNGQRMLAVERTMPPGTSSLRIPEEFPSGLYILRIHSRDRVETIRLMIE